MPFADPPGSTVTASDTNRGTANVLLQMLNGAGAGADYHGTTGSGVAGAINGGRALDFTSNGTSQPGIPGPLAATTNTSLGFGLVSNFTVSFWFKQNGQMAAGANIGPRLFVLGSGTPADTGASNSLGVKLQAANQLYFQLGSTTAAASLAANLPTNVWLFLAAVYDGNNLSIYQGTDTNPASLITAVTVATNINFGTTGALYVGDRQDRQRSFNGWISDFRLYTGAGDTNFVENIRMQAVQPQLQVMVMQNAGSLTLSWPYGVLQTATNLFGTWNTITGAVSPAVIPHGGQQQLFYRIISPP